MNVAIIFHSLSGQTKKLAGRMAARLIVAGHSVKEIELRTNKPIKSGTIRQPLDFEVTNLPDLAEFDAICVGGPVWAFGPSTVAYKAILQMPALKGKKALSFVTMGFPLKGMGGTAAIRHMNKALTDKGAGVLPGIIVPKMFHNFDLLLEKAAADCVRSFS